MSTKPTPPEKRYIKENGPHKGKSLNLMDRLLLWLTRNRPIRYIDIDGNDYLERCYIGQLFGWTFYLHRFVSADSERRLHNHPWRRSFGLVLSGGYVEERLDRLCCFEGMVTYQRKIRLFNWITSSTFHRILRPKPFSWTLFGHGPRIGGWGFIGTVKTHGTYTDMKEVGNGVVEVTEGKVQNATVEFHQPFDTRKVADWWLTAPKAKDTKRAVNR